jgi:hypothetical protein
MPSLSRRHLLIISLYSLQFRNSLEAPGVEVGVSPRAFTPAEIVTIHNPAPEG